MKSTIISIIIAGGLIGASLWFAGGGSADSKEGVVANVSVVGGKQIVDVTARGGYSPAVSVAKAGMPTVLRVETRGTFDCSSALTIPSLGYRTNLPPTGITEIEIPPQTPGSILRGTCSMGMYNFSIEFN